MSTELHAFLESHRLPTVSLWQAAINALGLADLQLDPTAKLPHHVKLNGHNAAFDFQTHPAREITSRYPGLKGMFPTRDLAVTVRHGPDPRDRAAALIALAAFVRISDAPWFDPAEGECYDTDAAIAEAKAALSHVK
jgi:hypothetical protein